MKSLFFIFSRGSWLMVRNMFKGLFRSAKRVAVRPINYVRNTRTGKFAAAAWSRYSPIIMGAAVGASVTALVQTLVAAQKEVEAQPDMAADNVFVPGTSLHRSSVDLLIELRSQLSDSLSRLQSSLQNGNTADYQNALLEFLECALAIPYQVGDVDFNTSALKLITACQSVGLNVCDKNHLSVIQRAVRTTVDEGRSTSDSANAISAALLMDNQNVLML